MLEFKNYKYNDIDEEISILSGKLNICLDNKGIIKYLIDNFDLNIESQRLTVLKVIKSLDNKYIYSYFSKYFMLIRLGILKKYCCHNICELKVYIEYLIINEEFKQVKDILNEVCIYLDCDCELYNYFGSVCYLEGNFNDALDYFNRSFSLDKNYYDAILNLAATHEAINEIYMAIEFYIKAIKVNPDKADEIIYILSNKYNILEDDIDFIAKNKIKELYFKDDLNNCIDYILKNNTILDIYKLEIYYYRNNNMIIKELIPMLCELDIRNNDISYDLDYLNVINKFITGDFIACNLLLNKSKSIDDSPFIVEIKQYFLEIMHS